MTINKTDGNNHKALKITKDARRQQKTTKASGAKMNSQDDQTRLIASMLKLSTIKVMRCMN